MEFQKFPKIDRYTNETFHITEKIDGTNAAIRIEDGTFQGAQSRKQIITPDNDNFGFARWAHDNGAELAELLGDGLHFGEWWGLGIQRGYGLTHRRFSLFNTHRHAEVEASVGGVPVAPVPVLGEGELLYLGMTLMVVNQNLREGGSHAAPGYMNPEGAMIYLHRLGRYLKAPLDPTPKGVAA